MIQYETAASDLPLSSLSVTERVFQGLTPRLDDVVIIDGTDGRQFTASEVIDHVKQLAGGLRASMGYCGCGSIAEMQAQAEFVQITSAGVRESHVHDVQITKEAPNYRVE